MPLTPETWLEEFTVNLTTTGSQSQPTITHLANGNILVAWVSSDDSGVGSPAGTDVIGQIFDPLGNRIGVEFLVNTGSSSENETDPDIAALPSGGFLSVFERPTSSGFRDLLLQEHDANGVVQNSVFPFFDGNTTGAPDAFDPKIAVSSGTSALVVWRETEAGGDSRIVGKIYDASTNTLGSEISLINFTGANTAPDVTVLSNGNYVIAGVLGQAGDNAITLRIISSTGANVLGATTIASTSGNGENDREPSVTALTGGGFVVSWTNTDTNDTDIEFQVFSATGALVGGVGTATLNGATDNGNESVVVPLLDGGFLVIYDEDTEGNASVRRYSSTGTAVGGEFVFTTGTGASQYDAELLDDGRVAITFSNNAGEISMKIVDIRDAPNNGVYTPDQYQIGTVGDDVFTADGISEFVFGHDGNDVITESGQIRQYFGGKGNDTLKVVSPINDDLHDGGEGIDTIDWSLSGIVGGTFDLGKGIATAGGQDEVMTGFENLIGTDNADTVFGTADANILEGRGGDDKLNGQGGIDTLIGGLGNDTYFVDAVGDIIVELAGEGTADKVAAFKSYALAGGVEVEFMQTAAVAGTDSINLYGNEFVQSITGNAGDNILNGKGGADTMRGLAGDDTYYVDEAGDIILEVAGQGTNDRVVASVSYALSATADIERMQTASAAGTDAIDLTGNKLAQTIVGNAGNNVLNGKGGADSMSGGDGDDTYYVDNAADIVDDKAGKGFDKVIASTTYTLSATTEIEQMQTSSAAGTNALNLTGNDFVQTLIGNAGNNRLDGKGGADTMNGSGGDDTYIVDNAGDVVIEGAGKGAADKVIASVSYALSANAEVEVMQTNGAALTTKIDLTGSSTVQSISGNNGANRLDGLGGSDTLRGFGGPDTFVFSTKITSTNVDTIVDFNVPQDVIELESDIFTGLTEGAFISKVQFAANTTGFATTADHRIIYETDTGNLYFDADGNGGGGRKLFGVVSTNLALTEDDFFVG